MFKVSRNVNIEAFYSGFMHRYDKDFIFTGERHDFWEFLYVVEGSMDVFEEDRIYEVNAGKMIFYSPMEFHSIRSAKGTDPLIIIMSFSLSGEGFDSLTEGVFDVSVDSHSLIISALNAYEAATKNGAEDKKQLAAIKIEEPILSMVGNQIPENTHINTHATDNYKMIVKCLNEAVYENISSEEMARRCGISLSSLKKIFKKYSGISVKKYYNNLRFLKAIELMNEGKSMAEISDILNFSSQHYFTVAFKKQCGLSPTQHKKTY